MGEEEDIIEILESLDEQKVEDIAEEIEKLEEEEGLTDKSGKGIEGIDEYESRFESNTDKIQKFIDRLEEKGVVELEDFKEDYREYLELKEQGAYGKALRTIPELVRKGEMIAEISEIISDAQEELKELPADIDTSEVEKKLDSIRGRVTEGDYREGLKEAKSIPSILSTLKGRESKEKRFKERLRETRKKINEARKTGINLGPVKSDLKKAVEFGEEDEYENGLKVLDRALEKLSLISDISKGLKEAKFEITILDNKNVDIRPYMNILKEAKKEAEVGDYEESLARINECLEEMEESSVLESFVEIERKFTGDIPAADLSNLVAPVYSFLVPIFLVIYVCIEFSAVLLVFPLISPSRVLLYLTPMPMLQGESLPSLTASFFVALGLLVSTLISYDFSETTLSIKRKTIALSLAISLSMGVSLGMYVYFVPYSLARVHHYVVFFLTLILIATQLDLVLNHKKFVRKIEGGKREGKGLNFIDSTSTSSIFSLSLSTLSFSSSSLSVYPDSRKNIGRVRLDSRETSMIAAISLIAILLVSGLSAGFNGLNFSQEDDTPTSDPRSSDQTNNETSSDTVKREIKRGNSTVKNKGLLQKGSSNKARPINLVELISGNSSESERYGWNISKGDLNSDGYNDIIIGAPYNDSQAGGIPEAGAVYIFLGYKNISDSGLKPSSANVTIYGNTDGGHLGWDVCGGGDIDNDGYEDLVLGEPDNGSGSSYVFKGRQNWQDSYSVSDADITLNGASPGDMFGMSVSGGFDANGDGYDELAIGAPLVDVGTETDTGAAYVLQGNSSLGNFYQAGDGEFERLTGEQNTNMEFGFSVSGAGDLDKDGYEDLAVGVPNEDKAYVYYGSEENFLVRELNTTVDDFNSGTGYHTKIITNSTSPPSNNGDVILADETPNEGSSNVDGKGDIYDEENSTGDIDDTEEKDGNRWNVQEAGGEMNQTATGENTVNGSKTNSYTETKYSDDSYEILSEGEGINGREERFFDGFEDGDLQDPDWTTSNNPTVTSSTSSSGTYSAGADAVDGSRNASFEIGIDTTNYTSIEFQYDKSTSVQFWAGVTLTSWWYDGSTWHSLESVSGDNAWSTSSFSLPSSAGENPDFKIRFTVAVAVIIGGAEGWVDDVTVSGRVPTSSLEHTWSFSIPSGSDKAFNAEAFHPESEDHDNFTFYYSTTGNGYVGTAGWTEMFTVRNTSDEDYVHSYTDATLEGYEGTIYVGVLDTDRGAWNTTQDSLYIDRLWFDVTSERYYRLEFGFYNLGTDYTGDTSLSFYGYEEANDCNVSVWDNSSSQWIRLNDIDIGQGAANEGWYNSSTNLTQYIFDEKNGRLAIMLNKTPDLVKDGWIHIDFLGLRFDPYVNNGTFYSAITHTETNMGFVEVYWNASDTTDAPSNLNLSVSSDGGKTWDPVISSGAKVDISRPGKRLMYKCDLKLLNRDRSPVLHSVKLIRPHAYNILLGGGKTGFGWDVSGGKDIDGDSYDDLLIGAPVKEGDKIYTPLSDNFEDGDLNNPDWTTNESGGGSITVNTDTSNSGQYSMRTGEGTCSALSKPMDLNTLSSNHIVNLSVWIRRGDDAFSEDPDINEDLQIHYLNQNGNWVMLESFPGAGTPGEIFERTYKLSEDAFHSDFRLRFTQTAGTGSGWDYWHIDDVYINYTYEHTGGRVYLFNGGRNGVSQKRGRDTANTTISGTKDRDRFGYSLDMGDLNDDGHADIYVGAPYNDTADGTVSNAGGLYVFQGESSMKSSMTAVNATADYYGSFSDIYTGWSVCHLGTIGRIDPIAVGKPGWSNWYGNVTVLSRQRLAIINYRGMFQDNQNVTQDYAEVYNVSENTLDLKINVTAEMGWTSSFEGLTIRGWVDNGSIGNASDYPELDYPNTRWNLSYNGTGWALLSPHPNDEIMLNSTDLTYSKEKTRNWTVSLYLGNQTRYTPKNGSGSNYSGLDTANTWDVSWNVSVSRGKGATVYNELGISKFCSVWTNDTNLYNNSGIPDTYAYPKVNGGGQNPVIHYSANYDFNLSVYPMNPLDNDESGEKIGLGNVSINTSHLSAWRSMSNGELGNNSASEINLFGGVQAAPRNRTDETITVSWRVYIPAGTPGWSYSSEQITYHIEIVDGQ